jgi:hypothetical protein
LDGGDVVGAAVVHLVIFSFDVNVVNGDGVFAVRGRR